VAAVRKRIAANIFVIRTPWREVAMSSTGGGSDAA